MSENKKPRLAEVLGVEVGEKFDINGELCNPFCIYEDGFLYDNSGFRRSFEAIKIINYPELIKRRPSWTEQEVKDAKNIIRLFGGYSFPYVSKTEGGQPVLIDDLQPYETFSVGLEDDLFSSLKYGETVKLADIIGGNE